MKVYKNECNKCECWKCELKESCIHKDSYRRMPKENGGLSLCKKIQKQEVM